MKIQGHLRDQPLPELFKLLASRCESGCLRIAFEPEPVLLYFKAGQLVDARTSFLQGLPAISLAFSRPKAAFEFDDAIVPPESTLTDQNEKLLLGQILRVERTGETAIQKEPQTELKNAKQPSVLLNLRSLLAATTSKSAGIFGPKQVSAPTETTSRRVFSSPEIPVSTEANSPLVLSSQVEAAIATSPEILTKVVPSDSGEAAHGSDIVAPISLTVPGRRFRHLPREKLLRGIATLLVIAIPAVVAITVRLNKRASATPVIAATKQPVPQDSSTKSQKMSDNTLPPKAGSVPTSTAADTTPRSPSAKNAKAVANEGASESPGVLEESATDPTPKQPIPPEQQQSGIEPTSRTIAVVVKIEQGRVTEAWVKESHGGLEAFEATAIRLTRQRHYPKEVSRTETVAVNVTANQ